ncbi:MAG TPA: C-terminal binding protein [Dehalococcoidia bacterium]|jgi:D-3-phosphoglycerate dehydrogenase|nr:C-terminal binding protein [Dehalococcoidia bacterium]
MRHTASFKVVLPFALSGESAKYPQQFGKLGAEFISQPCASDEEFIALARDADAVITVGSIRPVPRKVIESLERCRLISNTQIGYDSIDIAAATERGILVTNVPDYCVEEVSDHAMALILACSRKIVQLNQAVKKGQWGLSASGVEIQNQIWPEMSRLQGQTLGLFGFGRVARALVPKAKGFQMRVIAHDPYVPPEVARQMGVEPVDWERLLQEADFLSIHAALTPQTRHIMNAEAFKLMKPTACLINTARGGFVDESALYQALKEGRLAMAALDVTDPEPPDPQSPLLALDNVISTAHSAFFSPDSEAERWRRPVLEVARVMRGEWPKAVVNPQAKERYTARWGEMKEPT